jgi:hypothetical protein
MEFGVVGFQREYQTEDSLVVLLFCEDEAELLVVEPENDFYIFMVKVLECQVLVEVNIVLVG